MPMYGYVCDACDTEMDILHKMGENKRKCPKCGTSKLRRSWKKIAAFHDHKSPMHPRANRGRGH